ncbi:MFS transporter [Agromyces silvae]|uniref:MFS transporter n=1 Tax=Agromyces silvae TaxID=3388266 RepID=UPI00280BA2E0|nr:MFS transporter [Agromyces protaetiae]
MDTQPRPPVPTVAPKTRRTGWWGVAALALPALLASLELTVTNLALPSIAIALQATSLQLLWIADVYALLLAGSLVLMGALGDRFGSRRILLLGAAGYGVASCLAAFAPTADTLIVARGLMGIAGATLMPSTLALASSLFPDARRRATAVAMIIASVSAGTALGPLVGGVLLEQFWWGSAFLIGAPIMLLVLVLVPMFVPERPRVPGARLDVLSAALICACLLLCVAALKRLATGELTVFPLLAILLAVGLGVWFVRRQLRSPFPLLDVRLFAGRRFTTTVLTLTLGIFVLWGSNYALAQLLQLVLGLSPIVAGIWTAAPAVAVIAGSTLAPRWAARFTPERVTIASLVLAGIGYTLLGVVSGSGDPLLIIAAAVLISAGLGPIMVLTTAAIIESGGPERAGAAAAISSTAPQVGGAVGLAVLGSIGLGVYRSTLEAADLPRRAAELRDRAMDGLAAIAPPQGGDSPVDPLLGAVRTVAVEAQIAGLQAVAFTCAGVLLACVIANILAFRKP